MTKLLCTATFLLASCLSATAEQTTAQQTATPQPTGWARVEALPSGVAITVKATHNSMHCHFKSATDDALTCVSQNGATTQVYTRAEVMSVKLPRRGRSTLAGLAIGAGGGAVFGAAIGRSGSFVPRGAAAAVLAVPGALIGAIVGASTDFTHSTVYKAK